MHGDLIAIAGLMVADDVSLIDIACSVIIVDGGLFDVASVVANVD